MKLRLNLNQCRTVCWSVKSVNCRQKTLSNGRRCLPKEHRLQFSSKANFNCCSNNESNSFELADAKGSFTPAHIPMHICASICVYMLCVSVYVFMCRLLVRRITLKSFAGSNERIKKEKKKKVSLFLLKRQSQTHKKVNIPHVHLWAATTITTTKTTITVTGIIECGTSESRFSSSVFMACTKMLRIYILNKICNNNKSCI